MGNKNDFNVKNVDLSKIEFSTNLKKIIGQKFKSVAAASRELGIPEGTLRYSYLNGKSYPGYECCRTLIKKGVKASELFMLETEHKLPFVQRLNRVIEFRFNSVEVFIKKCSPAISEHELKKILSGEELPHYNFLLFIHSEYMVDLNWLVTGRRARGFIPPEVKDE